jgi:hypothetical protein
VATTQNQISCVFSFLRLAFKAVVRCSGVDLSGTFGIQSPVTYLPPLSLTLTIKLLGSEPRNPPGLMPIWSVACFQTRHLAATVKSKHVELFLCTSDIVTATV